MLVFQFFAITFIKVWLFHYKHMGTMCKRSNYTQNSPQYEGDCEYRITSSPSLEGKYSEHGSPARRGAPSFRGTSLFVGGDTREGLVKINVARRAELSR